MALPALVVVLFYIGFCAAGWAAIEDHIDRKTYPNATAEEPMAAPPYMVDNTRNNHGTAPQHNSVSGMNWLYSGSFDDYIDRLSHGETTGWGPFGNETRAGNYSRPEIHKRQSSYWLTQLAPMGKQPMASDGYVFYRDVSEYGATGDPGQDAVEAINAAIKDGERCGERCGNTFAMGAIIYFPPGTYKVCRPIIQLYYTQFIGDPDNPPIIKGCDTFKGIAMVDTDPYVPGGGGIQWFVNQNQFFRHIRNFVFDLTDMPLHTTKEGEDKFVPTGLHWQVAQATSLEKVKFKMPTTHPDGPVTHVGVFTENGSGGFAADVEFEGGNIGWRIGSQQFTLRSLKFRNCITAIQMIWDWGFNWQDIDIQGGTVAFDISANGGIDGQGTGSISIMDSTIRDTPIGILTRNNGSDPSIVITNSNFENVNNIVLVRQNGDVLLSGPGHIDLWATGKRYEGSKGKFETGSVQNVPPRPASLLNGDGKLFVQSRPQWRDLDAGSFLIATDYNADNSGTGDQAAAVNAFLRDAAAQGKVAFFPAGIYRVESTVTIPRGSKVQGSSWSQIQGAGAYFEDMNNPKVVVQVGEKEGEVGSVQIVEMIFSTRGPTAGAIVLQWNLHEEYQGSAAMWDSHVRVGGARGSDLDFDHCPKHGFDKKCICASLLMHVMPKASGYFENVWLWLGDHDNDKSMYYALDSSASQISIYAARALLIESQGPSWFYGTGAEHAIMYQYQLYKAKNVYLGHIQSETPYYQPNPPAPEPFQSTAGDFPGDPTFTNCKADAKNCKEAWGLRIIDSEDVLIHSAGVYQFFDDYTQQCINSTAGCQDHIVEVKGGKNVALFNLFTIGVPEVASGKGNTILANDTKSGYTTEVSVWLPGPGEDDEGTVVYLDPKVYEPDSNTAWCPNTDLCRFIPPPIILPSPTTIPISPLTTSVEVGQWTVVDGKDTFQVVIVSVTIPATTIVTDTISVSNANVSSGASAGETFSARMSVPLDPIVVTVTNQAGKSTGRTLQLPPWPQITRGPAEEDEGDEDDEDDEQKWVDEPEGPEPDPDEAEDPGYDFEIPLCETEDCYPIPEEGDESYNEVGPIAFQWPEDSVEVVVEENDDNDDDDDDDPSCKLWFFFVCVKFKSFKIKGLKWNLPRPTFISPGPPPQIKWPASITIKGTLPGPWPSITVGLDGKPTPPSEKPQDCTTESAELCYTTTKIGTSVSGTITRTTRSETESECATVYGCVVEDYDEEVTTKSGCSGTVALTYPPLPGATGAAQKPLAREIQARQASGQAPSPHQPTGHPCATLPMGDGVILVQDPENEAQANSIIQYLQSTVQLPVDPVTGMILPGPGVQLWAMTTQVRSPTEKFTAYFFVSDYLSRDHVNHLNTMSGVGYAYIMPWWPNYYWKQILARAQPRVIPKRDIGESSDATDAMDLLEYRYGGSQKPDGHGHSGGMQERPITTTNLALTNISRREEIVEGSSHLDGHALDRRGSKSSPNWELFQVSAPPGTKWKWVPKTSWTYHYHDAAGEGQHVYVVEEGAWRDNPLWGGLGRSGQYEELPETAPHGKAIESPMKSHGTNVVARVASENLGVAKKAQVVLVTSKRARPPRMGHMVHAEKYLDSLIRVLEDVASRESANPGSRKGRSVVNLSFGYFEDEAAVHPLARTIANKLLKRLEARFDVLIVAAAHNQGSRGLVVARDATRKYLFPPRRDSLANVFCRFGAPENPNEVIESLIVAGSTNPEGRKALYTPYQPWMVMAPAEGYYHYPNSMIANANETTKVFRNHLAGNSFAAPLISGLAALLRSMPTRWKTDLEKPRNVKALIQHLSRHIQAERHPALIYAKNQRLENAKDKAPFIWNGQVDELRNCLIDSSWARGSGGTPAAGPGRSQAEKLAQEKLEKICEPFKFDDINTLPINPPPRPSSSCRQTPVVAKRDDLSDKSVVQRQEQGQNAKLDTCPAPGGTTITYSPGAPSPTCSGNCGTICTGYFCNPTPTGEVPGFHDPEDPRYKTRLDLPSLTGTSMEPNCLKTTQGIYVGPGRAPLVTTVCKALPTPTTREPSYDQPVGGKVCSNQCRLDRGYECDVGERDTSPESPDCCPNGGCGFCADYDDAHTPECCSKPGNERDNCKWTRSSIGKHRPAAEDCSLYAYAIEVTGCVNVMNGTDCASKGMLKGYELYVGGKEGSYKCSGCPPNGRRSFSSSDLGVAESVVMDWNGRNDQSRCQCSVDGQGGSTHKLVIDEEGALGFEKRKGIACACDFKCHPFS